MRLLRLPLVLLASFAAAACAKADTINFTVTVTSQVNLYAVPIGSTYTGFVHYDGSVDPNFTGYPPTVTSYGFDYPSAPASLAGLKDAYTQRHIIGGPLFVLLTYIDFSSPAASFDISGDQFTIFTPISETANGFSYSKYEGGTVTYTYAKDPVVTPISPVGPPASPVPEPSSLALLGTGLVGALATLRRRTRTI